VRTPRAHGEADLALAETLGEQLRAAITRSLWVACFADQPRDHGVPPVETDYRLDGLLQRDGNEIRIALSLQDSRAGGQIIWTRQFGPAAADSWIDLEAMATEAAAQLDPVLLTREGQRASETLSPASPAQQLTLGAIPGLLNIDRDAFERSGALLTEALRLSPDDAHTMAWLAHWHVVAGGQGWSRDQGATIAAAGNLAERAVTLAPTDARALTIAAHVRAFLWKQVDESIVLNDRAIATNPGLAIAWAHSGLSHCYRGDHHEAIRRIETARRLSPFDPDAYFFELALMLPHMFLRDFERAVTLGRMTAQLKPGFSSSWKGLLVSLAHLGRRAEADDARARLLALEPGFTVSQAMTRSPLRAPEDRACYAEGLRLGGLPE
jgi:Flp pilus assembly protein TadD